MGFATDPDLILLQRGQQPPLEGSTVSAPKPGKKQPILSLRSAVLVLGAVIVGAAAGALTFTSSRSLASAVFAGAAAFAAALLWLDHIVA